MSTAATPTTAEKPKTRIARFALPQLDANSALLPPDKWIIDTAKDFIKTNKSFQRTAGKILGFAGLGLTAIGAGITAAIMLPVALPLAATSVAALAVAGFSGFKVKQQVDVFKKDTLKELKEHIGKKYVEFKIAEMKAAWQRKVDERAKAKAAQKVATAAQTAATPDAKTEAPKAPEKPAEKASEKTSGGGFGKWVLKAAMEKAQKKPDAAAPEDKPAAVAPKAPQPPKA